MAPIKIAVNGYGVPRETPSEGIIVSTIPKGEGSSAAERDCCAGRGKGEEESCCGRHGGHGESCCSDAEHGAPHKGHAGQSTSQRHGTVR